jgi:DNA mismatch repair protein MutS
VKVISRAGQIRAAAQAVATLDALISFARCAADYGYARPVVDDSGVIEIVAGRHPVVERMLEGERFVPNDVRLDCESAQVLIITGPNMAGKSTVMRQVALIALLAQAGSFVPAQRARIGAVDRIFTRVGAADNLARGQSTFMVEMTETAYILHHATAKSLVVLDEIGRGTSTFDGLSIAWAVAETLHDRVGARTLFATHYHELQDLAREKPRVVNCSIAVKETQGQVVAGVANRSYGIEVARLAGVPPEVLARAREILANLESGELDDAGRPTLIRKARQAPDGQLALFEAPAASAGQKTVLDELAALELDATTPIEALNALARWKKLLE